jgi:predicted  nucleic acid-binding Zn-ribbon protein
MADEVAPEAGDEDVLAALFELQRLDRTLDGLEEDRRRGPERLALDGAQSSVALARARVAELEGELARAQEQRLAAWEEMERQRARSERLVAQARAGAGGMRASEALEHEAETARLRQGEAEDAALSLMEAEEGLAGELKTARAALAEAERAEAAALASFERREEGRRAEEAVLGAERRALAERLPPGLVQRYERLRARSEGVGVVSVVHGVCSGCQLRLSAAGLEEARPRAGASGVVEPGTCEHCGRLVVAT